MKKDKYMSWDVYFMSVAILSSFRSKDPKTQTGACIVDSEKKIIGIGYNGLPRGVDDNNPRYWKDLDDNDHENSKHSYVVHAEKNAIFNSNLHSLKDSTLYVTLFPCQICAQAIIQVGIKKVVYIKINESHVGHNNAVLNMFKEAGIEMVEFDKVEEKDLEFIDKLKKMRSFYLD